jgi:hypothetical protein
MPVFPGAIASFRTFVNRAEAIYNAAKTKIIYAEDMNALGDEVVAIETALGVDAVALASLPLGISSGGTSLVGIPATEFYGSSVYAFSPAVEHYTPFRVARPVNVSALLFNVTVAPASDALIRFAIYAADSEDQPTGAPVFDSGDIAVASGFTGVKTTAGLDIDLPAGRYLFAFNMNVGMTLRLFYATASGLSAALATGSFVRYYLVNRAYAAYPTPGVKWDSVGNTTNIGRSFVGLLKWTE